MLGPHERLANPALALLLLLGCGDVSSSDDGGDDTTGGETSGEDGSEGLESTGPGGSETGAGGSTSGGDDAPVGSTSGSEESGNVPVDDCDPIDLEATNQVVELPNGCPSPTCTSTGLTPLSDLGAGDFLGAQGGLYCGGSNVRPPSHDARGLMLADEIQPRASDGQVDEVDGSVVMLSIGMSNTNQEFGAFLNAYGDDPQLSDRLVIVNGALSGQASEAWSETELPWMNLDNVLASASVTPAQVAVVWIKLTHLEGYSVCGNEPPFQGPIPCFPAGAKTLYDDMVVILQRVEDTFPNVQIAYLSGRVYGGYANGGPSPDPFAYASSFAMKGLILDQITGNNPDLAEPLVPWLAWGPELWADGLTPRSDGLTWELTDFEQDGIHPSASGRSKVADLLWDFFSTDTTSTPWFLDL